MFLLGVFLNVIVGGICASPAALAGVAEEYKVKAAFFYHFARFIEWPSERFLSDEDPFRICIVGENPFQGALRKTLSGKTVHGRPFRLLQSPDDAVLTQCHVVFIGEGSADRSKRITDAVHGQGVLTIGESADFIRQGGIVRLFLADNKVRFGINPQAAQRANLEISSKLLRLAKIESP